MNEYSLKKSFARAVGWNAFFSDSGHKRDELAQMLESLEPDPDILEFLAEKGPMHILALGETWCPDVIHHFPLLKKLEDRIPDLIVRYLGSDKEKELMGELHAEKSNTIPTILFLDSEFQEMGRITGRKPAAKTFMINAIAGRKIADIPREEVQATLKEFNSRFASEFVRETYDDIRWSLTKICLL